MNSLCRGSLGGIHQWLLGTAKHHQLLLIQTLTPFPPPSSHVLLLKSAYHICAYETFHFETHTGYTDEDKKTSRHEILELHLLHIPRE